MKKWSLSLISILLFVVSCDYQVNSENSYESRKNKALSITYNGSTYNLDEVVKSFDQTDLIGVIQFEKDKRNDIIILKNQDEVSENEYDGTETYIEAKMFKSDFSPLDLKDFKVNGISLNQYIAGSYKVAESIKDAEVNFGSGMNKFHFDSKDNSPTTLDSVEFPKEITLNNLKRKDTISKGRDKLLTWIGGIPGDKVKLSIEKTPSYWDTIVTTSTGFSMFIDNKGGFNLKSLTLQSLLTTTGLYDLKVTNYHPVYKMTSNGKKILCLAISSHKITVFLTE